MADSKGTDPPAPIAPEEKAKRVEEAYVRGLIERGEAARADEHGNLPPGATHEIIGVAPSGSPIVVRRRFYGGRPGPTKSE
jgi:hypothetical protein